MKTTTGALILKTAIIMIAILACSGCKRKAPEGQKLVETEASEGSSKGVMVGWLACTGPVEVTQKANGYAVKLKDRQWNDSKTAFVDVDTYLETKRVTIRPMNDEEISVCKTGHGLPASSSVVPTGGDDCYDSDGNLEPDSSLAFGGVTIKCGLGQSQKPKSERVHVPAEWRAWVESWEACDKAVVDSKHSTKAAFDACRTTAQATRPKSAVR